METGLWLAPNLLGFLLPHTNCACASAKKGPTHSSFRDLSWTFYGVVLSRTRREKKLNDIQYFVVVVVVVVVIIIYIFFLFSRY